MKKLLVLGGCLIAFAGCSSTTQDLKGVDAQHPDRIVVVQNADRFPNVSILCIEGHAILTTTRDYMPAQPAPSFDGMCAR